MPSNPLTKTLKKLTSVLEKHHNPEIYSLYEYILKFGTNYTPQPRPPQFSKMTDKMCFHNAQYIAKKYGLTYVEGFALTHGLPVFHAWCIQGKKVIEVTWNTPGTFYRGVPFHIDFVTKHRSKKCMSILDNYHDGFPLLRRIPKN